MTPHPLRHTSPHPPPKVPTWLIVAASALAILAAVLFVDAPQPCEPEAAQERQRHYEATRRSPEFQEALKALRDE